MQQIIYPSSTLSGNIDDNNSTLSSAEIISYHSTGNFIPPEWNNLKGDNQILISKTSKRLLSIIVYCMQHPLQHHHKPNSKLYESYHFFQSLLGVCQRRVRQCMLELTNGGFISVELKSLVLRNIKCRNVLSITLLKNFYQIPESRSNRGGL